MMRVVKASARKASAKKIVFDNKKISCANFINMFAGLFPNKLYN